LRPDPDWRGAIWYQPAPPPDKTEAARIADTRQLSSAGQNGVRDADAPPRRAAGIDA